MSNVKIRTPDVQEIQDSKIEASSPHSHIGTGVSAGDTYDAVLAQIASSCPTFTEKQALDAAQSPSAANPFVTFTDLTTTIANRIPWISIGQPGSGADYEGTTDAVFTTAFASGASWFQVAQGTYTFASTVSVPAGVKVVGVTTSSTIVTGNIASPLFTMEAGSYLSFMNVQQQSASGSCVSTTANDVSLEYLMLSSPDGGTLVAASAMGNLKMFTCSMTTGTCSFNSVIDSYVHGCLFNSTATFALSMSNCSDVTVTASLFMSGAFSASSSVYLKAVSNHFASGTAIDVSTSSTSLLRANTPDTYNNEVNDFFDLLSYIGSPSITTVSPTYSNNYSGAQGQDLTARASALDLLVQWRYEERNFHLVAQTEPTTVTWNQGTFLLTSTGPMEIQSSHRNSYWLLPSLNVTVPNGSCLYYTLDRTLNSAPLTLTPQLAAIGTVPNSGFNGALTTAQAQASQQTWVLAFNLNGTLWWRGGGGTRFPSTGTQVGTYFVDGTSKSLLDYIGSPDYNVSQPNYSDNFAGVNGENLVTRINKHDQLIRALYQNTNVGTYLSDASYISVEAGTGSTYALTLAGTFYMAFPNVAGRHFATGGVGVVPASWNLADGDIVYFTLALGNLSGSLGGTDMQVVAATKGNVNTSPLPLPDDYYDVSSTYTVKYFVFARRSGSSVFLWDNSELPVGGRYPEPIGRTVVAVSAPSSPSGAWTATSNTQWDGTNFLWQGLALAVATGASIGRNTFPDQTTPVVTGSTMGVLGTDLAEGQGLLVTHSWNAGSDGNVTIQKVNLPLTNTPLQNQFLWCQRRNNVICFIDD